MLIAEIGINHNGSLETALKLIAMAKEAGADVVKFQKRDIELCVPIEQRQVIRDTPWGQMTYFEYKKRMEFGLEEYKVIDLFCSLIGMRWTASVWDVNSLNFILQFDVPFIKIPSALITDLDLLMGAAACGKPVVISIGMSSTWEVAEAVHIFDSIDKPDLTILHCNSSYPAKEDELDLNIIPKLRAVFPWAKIGYSGHEEGIWPSIIAKSLGASVIERHITLDKSMWGTDQKASLEFEELKQLIDMLNKVDVWKGQNLIKCYPSEEIVKAKLRP